EKLRGHPGTIRITCPAGGTLEPVDFARQLGEVFRLSGGKVLSLTLQIYKQTIPTAGLLLLVRSADSPPSRAVVLRDAFESAGMPIAFQAVPRADWSDVTLSVGFRQIASDTSIAPVSLAQ